MSDPNTPGWAQQQPQPAPQGGGVQRTLNPFEVDWSDPLGLGGGGDKKAPYGVNDLVTQHPQTASGTTPIPQWAAQNADPRVDHGQYANLTPGEKFAHGISDPQHPNLWNFVYGTTGAFQQSVTNGLMMEPARQAMESSGYGMDRVKKLYPGQSDEFYKAKLHDFYNDAVTSSRQGAYQQTADNPYPGHQIANTAAGILGSADPTWLLAPGAGMAKGGALKTIASRGAVMAGLGSASDSAAQLMDMAEGQKKDFDVGRNLQAAAMSGAFGSAHATLTEVPGFVKNLFGTRGVDTTPSVDPRTATHSPTTGDNLTMSPDEQSQFKQLLQSGSVDDIKGFLATKQGPKPTWAQVNQMVEFRDKGLPESYVGQDKLKPALDAHIDEAHKSVVQDHIDAQTQDWKNKPDFELINHVDDIQDPVVKQHAINEGANDPNTLGFVGQDGKVRIFANRMDSPDTLNAVMYHEALGHYGLQQQFGNRLDSTLTTLLDRNVGKFGSDVDAWQKANPGAYGGDRLRAAEEVLAEASQNGRIKPSVSDAIVSNLRGFGRKMGLKLSYSDAEVQHILSMAHDAVVNGKPDAASNGFRGTKPTGEAPNSKWLNMSDQPAQLNKFMFTGQRATDFDKGRTTAFEASDGHVRNEISDHKATVNFPEGESSHRLEDVLDHPDLYRQYPELRDARVVHTEMGDDFAGAYSPKSGNIYINTKGTNKLGTTIHEVQHRIQDLEGYPGVREGDTLNSSMAEHDANPLEKEAMLTEDRRDLTDSQRVIMGHNKFMNRQQLAASGDYAIQQVEHAYNALDKDYVPTVRSFDEVKREALEAGFKASQIKDFGNTPDLSKRLFRIQAAGKVLDMRISDILKKLDTPDWSVKDADNLRQAIVDHQYILTKLRDERAEVARALNMSKLGYTRTQMESYGELLREQGGTLSPLGDDETLLKFARQLRGLKMTGNQTGMNSMVNSLSRANWEDYLTTLHQNMMLSGVSTHVKAPVDMMIGIGRDLLDSAGALPLSAGREALRAMGVNLKPGVHPTEVAARLWGVLKAGLDADTYKNSASTFINSGVNPNGFGGKQNARIPIVSKVTDLISAQDAFFRAFATNMHLYGLGTRKALDDARLMGTPKDWDTIMTQGAMHARNPTPELLKGAKDAADVTLLLNKNALTAPLDRMKATTPDSSFMQRTGAFVANFLAPFVRVETNSLMNRVIRRSPLAFLDPETIKDIKAGGARADVAWTRIIMGTGTIAAAWAAAGQKKTTGDGPPNAAKRAELEAGGWRPNATHEDGQYNTGDKLGQSFNPFDYHNATATTVAGLREAYERGANQGQVGTGIKLALLSTMKNLTDMSWASDFGPVIDAATAGSSGESKVSHFIASEAQTMVPNLLGQTARVEDQAQPHTDVPGSISESALNSMKAAVPGLRETLPVKHTVYGNPVQSGASMAGQHTWLPQDNRITGGNHVNETTDPAEIELERLSSLIPSALVTAVQRTVTVNGAKKQLSVREFEDYQHLAGRAIVETVRQEMSTPEWQHMSDQEKVLEVKSIEKDMKKAAKEQLYGAS